MTQPASTQKSLERSLAWRRILVLMILLFPLHAAAQPRLEATVSTEAPQRNERFLLTLEVRCPGGPDRFVLYPPSLTLPASVSRGAVQQGFSSRADGTVFSYQYTLTASSEGPLELGTATVDYRDMEGGAADKPEPLTVVLPTVQVAPDGAMGMVVRSLPMVLGAVVLLGYFWVRRRRARVPLEAPSQAVTPSASSLLIQMREALTAGELDRAYALLAQMKPLLPAADDPLPSLEQLEAERLRARYGGVSGAQSELERLFRAVEVLLKPPRHETCIDGPAEGAS